MKKCIALTLGLAMFASNVYGQITTNYVEDNVETTQENYSISGSSDPNYPLYINGEAVDRTASGYFSKYVTLAEGENKFELENTSDSKTITINRTVSNTGSGDTSSEDEFKAIDAVGVVNRNHPTVRSRADEENDDLIGPYVAGTLVHIIGESEDYYKTANGAYLYTDSVDITDTKYDENKIKDVVTSGDAVEIKMDRATEYKCDLTSDGFKLTLYDTDATDDEISIDGGIVESITKESSSPAVYNIKFNEKNRVVGYMSYFNDGVYRLEFNERTILKNYNSLDGVKIVLDAGHGGTDDGALGLGETHEKDITLSITKYLGEYLKNKGAEIVYTRPTDDFVALTARTGQIIAEKPDISVSIHCNSMNAWNDLNNYTGTLNLYSYDTPTKFVEKLTEEIANSTYRKQNLALTRTSICPAVLIETGFISNPDEYEYLSKDENQKEMAEKIGYAIEQYFYGLNNIIPETTTEATTENTTAVFSDISGHWAESYIKTAFEKGILNGYNDGTFKPNNSVTRAEFIKILYTIFGNEENTENGDISFSDINGNEWYCKYVKWGVTNGLINGYDDNTFRANNNITREEAAVVLSKCANLSANSEKVKIVDADSVSSWAKDSVNKVIDSGIMRGDTNGCFNPKKSLTRAETAVLANKLN